MVVPTTSNLPKHPPLYFSCVFFSAQMSEPAEFIHVVLLPVNVDGQLPLLRRGADLCADLKAENRGRAGIYSFLDDSKAPARGVAVPRAGVRRPAIYIMVFRIGKRCWMMMMVWKVRTIEGSGGRTISFVITSPSHGSCFRSKALML